MIAASKTSNLPSCWESLPSILEISEFVAAISAANSASTLTKSELVAEISAANSPSNLAISEVVAVSASVIKA